eukprot:1035224-Amphidinium_carterae.2
MVLRATREEAEPEAEPRNHGRAASVHTQTVEQPCVLGLRDISLELSSDLRIYILWRIEGAPFQLPGIHLGVDLAAWQGILQLAPEGIYAPGIVRVRRVRPSVGETWEQVRERAVEVFRAEALLHTQRQFGEVPLYYWSAHPVLDRVPVRRG